MVLFWPVSVFFLPQALAPYHHCLNHLILSQKTLALLGAVSVFFFTAALSAIVFSCCTMLPTKRSSPNLVGFSASFFICLALLLYANSLAGSSLIFFHLLDTILRNYFRPFSIILPSYFLRKRWYPLLGPIYGCLCGCLIVSFVQADNLHFVQMIFCISLQGLFIWLFLCFVKVPELFHYFVTNLKFFPFL